ncbi:transcription factor GTE1-like [Senna tora]|uniref:Transcription factor GTE1-like n=1 Tax=Senna tora TaxID=362788 RepID=A0A834X9G5_9FABA|nr:transcription factor GTE1-like [Senna tora]
MEPGVTSDPNIRKVGDAAADVEDFISLDEISITIDKSWMMFTSRVRLITDFRESNGIDTVLSCPKSNWSNDPNNLKSKRHFQSDDKQNAKNHFEKQVNEVEQFYQSTGNTQVNNSKGSSLVKDKGWEKHLISAEKQLQEASHREAAAARRMQELMRQFSTILRQASAIRLQLASRCAFLCYYITQHKWAWPFLDPVDVEGLGLHDYYEVIEKPMDFGTIKGKMDAKDGTGYKNVREIYADVRLVFKNAMKYNDEKNDVHVMAKTLLEKFEEKWLQLLPKVAEEEKRRLEEEAEAHLDMQLAREATYATMARDLSIKLSQIDMHLKLHKERAIQKLCRKLSSEEKRILGAALAKLSPENISRALEIVAENNPNFHAAAREVDLDIDAQSDYTLWRLKVFVKDALEVQEKTTGDIAFNNNENTEDKKNNSKRKREFCDAHAKTTVKRTKKLSTL